MAVMRRLSRRDISNSWNAFMTSAMNAPNRVSIWTAWVECLPTAVLSSGRILEYTLVEIARWSLRSTGSMCGDCFAHGDRGAPSPFGVQGLSPAGDGDLRIGLMGCSANILGECGTECLSGVLLPDVNSSPSRRGEELVECADELLPEESSGLTLVDSVDSSLRSPRSNINLGLWSICMLGDFGIVFRQLMKACQSNAAP
mmetsp:Transcript_74283/g.131217  ORF Transcript_74283/g.131217 Transcript_74283/m.131217 type:complete len:200 (-) Transcript_74283:279-878(-)